MKLFSSAYIGMVENNFAKSKQARAKFDVLPVPIFYKCGLSETNNPYDLDIKFILLVVDHTFRQSEPSTNFVDGYIFFTDFGLIQD